MQWNLYIMMGCAAVAAWEPHHDGRHCALSVTAACWTLPLQLAQAPACMHMFVRARCMYI